MPGITVPTTGLTLGPGFLFYAPLGSVLPDNTVTNGKFTDPWPEAWKPIGITKEGHEFSVEPDTDNVEVAEYLETLQYVTTGREIGMNFEIARITSSLMKVAMNGGTITSTGTGTDQLNQYTPPEIGEETRLMLGWESNYFNERLVIPKAFQQGNVTVARQKGADNATLPTEFRCERLQGEPPFYHWTIGADLA
ncbi:phage tail tube protein [Actinomadura opuntiae]|uniref:phage tail tube protein n=1 Tax=Actinomadura sp. OS1-43 TaxID=604315 RepID=UPI00255B2F96|nr:hypothetical protein [Actinomadura sp. OS1-43]MDL4812819.1 hypothetical protein [Actinomadura sp. OS1-43]